LRVGLDPEWVQLFQDRMLAVLDWLIHFLELGWFRDRDYQNDDSHNKNDQWNGDFPTYHFYLFLSN